MTAARARRALLLATTVVATGAVPAVAGAGPAASAGVEVFAVIVTNNRASNLNRPDLQYADDDGVHYYRTFGAVAKPGQVRLLTRFDRATEAAHRQLAAEVRPPQRAEVVAALSAMQAAIKEARRAGRTTHFYFVFAGHGDVEDGSGYVDLEDGRIDSAFLEREVVGRMGAHVQHILLDSCNSFFVVNPRKPGGRRWATPNDMALGFAKRHPNVGLFLSTNSEAEVYEWSELESGIFSHEVRSGLSGAADADGDGQVSYAELAGFVDRANAKLPRANLRPQVFFRGPAGDGGAALFDLRSAVGRRLALGEGERRLWIRGATGERLIDLHKEAAPMTVVVPVREDQPLSVIEWLGADEASKRPTLREYEIPPGTPRVSLAELRAAPASSTPRGGGAMFGQLFAEPYGARAFATYMEERAKAEPVYGVSSADQARMRHYLQSIAASDREAARGLTVSCLGMGTLLSGAAVALYFSDPRWEGSRAGSLAIGGLGLALLGCGAYFAVSEPLGARALDAFEAELRRSPGAPSVAVAKTEAYLDTLAQRERRTARIMSAVLGATALTFTAITTVNLLTTEDAGSHPAEFVVGYGNALLLGALSWHIIHSELPTERLLRLYREDPDLKLRVNVAPTAGGAALFVGGRF